MSTQQVWLITGAGRGLGVDIVKAALQRGHRVVATARNVEKAAARLGSHANLRVVALDVTRPEQAEAAMQATVEAPWYILHQSVLIAALFWLKPLHFGPVVEPLLVLVATVAGCLLLHECLIRRVRWLRPLFGLKANKTGARTGRTGSPAVESTVDYNQWHRDARAWMAQDDVGMKRKEIE